MSLSGERLLIAATLDEVRQDELFTALPSHLPVLDHFSIAGEARLKRLTTGIEQIFSGGESVLIEKSSKGPQGLYGGKLVGSSELIEMPARHINNVNKGPWFGLRALAMSLGEIDDDYAFKDARDVKGNTPFFGYVADTKERRIERGEAVSFTSIALIAFSKFRSHQEAVVLKSIQLGKIDG